MTEEKKQLHDKSLDKMTVSELREIAKELPDITGVHGMKKAELIEVVSKAKGGTVNTQKKSVSKSSKIKKVASVQELKLAIKRLREQKMKALTDRDKKVAKIYRRRISKLKKKTRRAA